MEEQEKEIQKPTDDLEEQQATEVTEKDVGKDDQNEQTVDVETTAHSGGQEDQLEKIKETTEKLWDSTVSAISTATFRANQYKKLVQKKIDLSALHKKISATHSDLGKLIDDLREDGKKSIMSQAAVKDMLEKLDTLKVEAAALEEEIEQIKTEEPGHEKDSEETEQS